MPNLDLNSKSLPNNKSILFIILSFVIVIFAIITWPLNNKINQSIIKTALGQATLTQIPAKNENANNPAVYAKAYYLIDVDSFYPMLAKNEEEKLAIASTTKIATAITVLENYEDRLQDVVTITPKMININGSDIQLRAGEKITVENLLHGLLIMSGNDTAYSLAEYFGGKEKFVQEMNEKVVQIGLKNTQYKCPAGLDDDGYSTAKDLATLGAYAMQNEKFASIVKIPEEVITSTDGQIQHELKASNRLIKPEEEFYYPYAYGVKTGFTYAAGHALVSIAQKDNHRLLGVILNTNESSITASAKESRKLLEWGFNNWQW